MSVEKIKGMDGTEFEGPVDTGDAHAKRPADKKSEGNGNESSTLEKKAKRGTDLPGTTQVAEAITAMFADVEGLSETFVSEATTIFEGAVSENIAIIREQIEQDHKEKLAEAYTSISEELATRVDEYLSLFTKKYINENVVALEKGIRLELAEQVVSSIVTIVESNGVDLPKEKIDIADALVVENNELEAKLNTSLNENIELAKKVKQMEINEAFVSATTGLSEATKDRLKKLTENTEYSSVEVFLEKFEVLKESISEKVAPKSSDLAEAVDEAPKSAVNKHSDRMASYLSVARESGAKYY